jgi:hypothetical protein
MVNVFVLIREDDDILWDYFPLRSYIEYLIRWVEAIELEHYTGYYDARQFSSLKEKIELVEDDYPSPLSRKVYLAIQEWENWRDEYYQDNRKIYSVYYDLKFDDTFCELAERKNISSNEDNFVLFDHAACHYPSPLELRIDNEDELLIDKVSSISVTSSWFANSRIPARKFHQSRKHHPNSLKAKSRRGKKGAPFYSTNEEAQHLLNHAVGEREEELIAWDSKHDMYVIFKDENSNNQYHGYHVPIDSIEVPKKIKELLQIK